LLRWRARRVGPPATAHIEPWIVPDRASQDRHGGELELPATPPPAPLTCTAWHTGVTPPPSPASPSPRHDSLLPAGVRPAEVVRRALAAAHPWRSPVEDGTQGPAAPGAGDSRAGDRRRVARPPSAASPALSSGPAVPAVTRQAPKPPSGRLPHLPTLRRPTEWEWEIDDPDASAVLLEEAALPRRIDLCAPQLIWHADGERLLVICPPDQNVWMLPTPCVRYTLTQLAETFQDGERPLLPQLRAGSSLAEVEVAALQLRAWLGAGCLDALRESLRSLWPGAVYGWPGRLIHTGFTLRPGVHGDTAGAVAVFSYRERRSVPAPDNIRHCWITPGELPEPDEAGTVLLRGRPAAPNLVGLLRRRWSPPSQARDPGDR
jgi:hypothetical protein